MQVEIRVGVRDELVHEGVRHLLAVTARGIAGEDTVWIHVVDRANEHAAIPKGRQIQHRHENDRPGNRRGLELAGQPNDGFNRGIFPAVNTRADQQHWSRNCACDGDDGARFIAERGPGQRHLMSLFFARGERAKDRDFWWIIHRLRSAPCGQNSTCFCVQIYWIDALQGK